MGQVQGPASSPPVQRPPSALRRPSGYFARRKSLGAGLSVDNAEDNATSTSMSTARTSPKKKAGVGLGRVSLGSGPAEAWTRFDKGKAKEREGDDDDRGAREEAQNAVASTSPSRDSPASASPQPKSPAARPDFPSPSVVDLSTLLSPGGFGDENAEAEMQVDPTAQWRKGVREVDLDLDEGVCNMVLSSSFLLTFTVLMLASNIYRAIL